MSRYIVLQNPTFPEVWRFWGALDAGVGLEGRAAARKSVHVEHHLKTPGSPIRGLGNLKQGTAPSQTKPKLVLRRAWLRSVRFGAESEGIKLAHNGSLHVSVPQLRDDVAQREGAGRHETLLVRGSTQTPTANLEAKRPSGFTP